MQFDHIGIVTDEKKSDEMYVAATKVWVTDFQNHPFHVEWLRFEPDTPVAGPVREGQAGDPKSPYGLSKYLASQAIEDSGFGCSLRFFNLYGPCPGTPGPYDGVVRRFLSLALSGESLTIHGLGSQTRDFVFIDDALTDPRLYRHRAELYRRGLAQGFTELGGGVWLSRRADVPLFELEAVQN